MHTRGFKVVKRLGSMSIRLPERSTKNSAGYDFFAYEDVTIPSMWKTAPKGTLEPTLIRTGVKAYMQEDEVLEVYDRSSNPKKLGLIVPNAVGIIDSDYYENPENDGEIGFMFYNIFPFDVTIKAGEKLGQGIFKKFLKVDNDNATGDREGGFGSTGR